MHAYASDDPVFLAMNARAQRENQVGDFCVRCHAPVAVREGMTQDGLNLASLPPAVKGVTCYFCHATQSVTDTHNNPLVLASDNSLFGPFGDPVPTTPHVALYSPYLDAVQFESAAACGSCHDIVNLQQAHVERTYEQWQTTLFHTPGTGLSCAECHMTGRDGLAATGSTQTRRVHAHTFPAVDLALIPFPETDTQQAAVQQFLDSAIQSTVCYLPDTRQIEVTLDNVGAGHDWPSGATPDRRAWIELTALDADGQVMYASGGAAALPLEGSPDPDLWLMRDCLFDAAGSEKKMFWQASSVTSDQVPGAVSANVQDPSSFLKSHIRNLYPGGGAAGAALPAAPASITLKVHLKAIGDDVLGDLVTTGDLDPTLATAVAPLTLGGGAAITWTAAAATTYIDRTTQLPFQCVTGGTYRPTPNLAVSHANCAPPPAP